MSSHAAAKIILFGEHAVVYGYPALAVPFGSLSATVTATPQPIETGLIIQSPALGQEYRLQKGVETFGGALTYAAQLYLTRINLDPPDVLLTIDSDIPLGGGFGSGAAVTAALIRELSVYCEHPLTDPELNDLVYEVEKIYHGTPSGIDNTTIVYNRPVYFIRGNPPQPFVMGKPLTLVIADTGVNAPTKESVGDVRRLRDEHPIAVTPMLDRIGRIVETAREALENGDHSNLGALMLENHGILRQLTVSSPLLDQLVVAALNAGAFGAKLSGGGRGGNLIALPPEGHATRVAAALLGAGAAKTWLTVVE
jgi:mevalonate kinase